MESIVFHAKKYKDSQDPYFTVRFGMEKAFGEDNQMYCVISKPHPYLESYCKKTGYAITDARLSTLVDELESKHICPISSIKDLAKFLPHGTANTLSYYVEKAKRYFKVDNPEIIIRGTKVVWTRSEKGSKANKETILLSAKSKDLS